MGMGALRPLPPNTAPRGTRCIQITIPDDDEWERDLYSVITELGQWPRWERDEAHSATLVARRWRAALRTFRYCDGTPSVIIEEFEDEMALCDQLRYHNGKLQVMCCGEWQDIPGADTSDGPPEGQPPPEDRPGPGESKCYNVKLNAAGEWLLPFGVSEFDTITITAASGGWSPGAGAWYCPNGQAYLGGLCVGPGNVTGTDPDVTAKHMELIGVYIDGTTFALSDSPVTVPSGFAGVQVTFQANDTDLTDNSGDITFNVCVTNNSSVPRAPWCFVFDFAASDYSSFWGLQEGEGGVYTVGVGWQSTPTGGSNAVLLVSTLPTLSGDYTEYTVQFVTDVDGHYYVYEEGESIDSGSLGAGTQSVTYSTDIVQPGELKAQAYGGHNYTINKITMRGTGVCPFGTSNC